MTAFVAYLVMVPVSGVLIGLMDFRKEMHSPILSRREYLGFAIMLGVLGGLIWPLILPVTFCMTGFAEHGIVTQR